MSTAASTHMIELGRGLSANPVLVKGDGPPVVYLHGLMGQAWDVLLDGLAAERRVHAPAFAGAGEPEELKAFDTVHDLVIYLDDVVRKLELSTFDLVGHSFGGMLAAEYAALFPERVRKLALIDPLGLWRDDAPVTDFIYVTPERQLELLLGVSDGELQRTLMALPDDPRARKRELVRRITSMASMLHFIWPIPERGLAKRLYRIAAPTQLIWGEDDRVVPPAYADDFSSAIRGSGVEIIGGASHTPHFNQPARVLEVVRRFLEG